MSKRLERFKEAGLIGCLNGVQNEAPRNDMKEIRPPTKLDQDETEKAYQMVMQLMNDHPEIESTLWCGAIWSVLVNGYEQCDYSYEEFCNEVKRISVHYKSWFDKE